ncbi:MAG: molybdopterin cofactor-binding domain-containing protein, partial [Massilia sp.]
MSAPVDLTRRRALQIGAAVGGGLLIGFDLTGCDAKKPTDRKDPPPETAVGAAATAASGGTAGLAPNAFIRIGRNGVVTLIMHKVEMGQGTYTAMPMLIAEELGVDIGKVKLEHAPANNDLYSDPLLGGQVTGGSTSVRGAWKPLREAGATARSVLVSAAAQQWKVDAATLQVQDGAVIDPAGKRSLGFGALVDDAAKLPIPKTVTLKAAGNYALIGKGHKRLDSEEKTTGKALFGIDARLPAMAIATVAASPVVGGKLKSADE